MFLIGTLVGITCHSFLFCGKDATDDSDLHVTQSSINYRYALLALLLVQMSVLVSHSSFSYQRFGFRFVPPNPIKNNKLKVI